MFHLYSFKFLSIVLILKFAYCEKQYVNLSKTLVWGPGLEPNKIVLPARYFFIHAVDDNGIKFQKAPSLPFEIKITGTSSRGNCRSHIDPINRGDGSYIVRYQLYDWCDNMQLEVTHNREHVAESPYKVSGRVHSHRCSCPKNIETWLADNKCPDAADDKQINWDLHSFKRVNLSAIRENLLKRYNVPESISLCNYVVKNGEIWRKCYGKYTGFSMFMDGTLNALSRVVHLPDMEFFLNLGDWPLSKKGGQQRTSGPYPIFSWCGSDDSYDITLPTYDLMESAVENMGRVSLDMLSVQALYYFWNEKEDKVFWRGRDSSRERLNLIDLSRKFPNLIDAALTNFFFFRDEEKKYGPKVPLISFYEFFKYKYQINLDGTVAAYRLPFLLGGNSMVFKQDSPFYEHFYSKLVPYKHYVPIKRDLSDLVEQIQWARENESQVLEIIGEARKFVEENLLPQHVYCYHMALFKEWSKRLVSPIMILPGMEKVEDTSTCSCEKSAVKDEL